MFGRLIYMRVGGVLTIALVMSILAGCGDQGAGTTRDPSGVTGWVHLGPQCPVQTESDPCDDNPAPGSRVTVAKRLLGNSDVGGQVVAHTTTHADGSYRVGVPPGTYVVTSDAGMSCKPMHVQVTSGAYSTVDVPCDTGIR